MAVHAKAHHLIGARLVQSMHTMTKILNNALDYEAGEHPLGKGEVRSSILRGSTSGHHPETPGFAEDPILSMLG